MTDRVKEHSNYSNRPANNEEAYFDDYGVGDYEQDIEVESGNLEAGGDQYTSSVPLTANQVRSRLQSLTDLLNGSDLSSEQMLKLKSEIQILESKVNYSQAQTPARTQEMLLEVQNSILGLEAKILGNASQGADTLNTEDGEESEALSQNSLKSKTRDLGKTLEKLFKSGFMTEEVYQDLRQKLDKAEQAAGDKDLLEVADTLLQGVDSGLDHIKQKYIEDGKPVDEVPGFEGKATPNGTLKALMELTGKNEKQVITAFRSAFPEMSGKVNEAKDIEALIKNEEAPFSAPPSPAVIRFLKGLDTELTQALAPTNQWNHAILGPAYEKAATRLTGLLQAIYGDEHVIFPNQPTTANGYLDWTSLNDIVFDGNSYSFTKETQGSTAVIAWDKNPETSPAAAPSSGPAPQGGGSTGGVDGKINKGKDWVEDKLDLPSTPDLPDLPGPL